MYFDKTINAIRLEMGIERREGGRRTGGPGPGPQRTSQVLFNEKAECSLRPGAMKYPGGPLWLSTALCLAILAPTWDSHVLKKRPYPVFYYRLNYTFIA